MCRSNEPIPWWQAFEDELVSRGIPLPEDYVAFRDANKRLPDQEAAITQKLHEVVDAFEGGPHALCLSGGGIRSATFAIGVLQGLAKNNVLPHLDYVSSVSGGGYAASWLSSWARRDGGILGVSHELGHGIGGGVFAPEAGPLAYLRRYCAYLNPHSGGMSADTWTIVATYLRNLLLTWSVLLPLILGVLILPRIGAAITSRWVGVWTANDSYRLLVLGGSLACASLAFAYVGMSLPSTREVRRDKNTPNTERQALRRFLWLCLTSLILAAFGIMLLLADAERNITLGSYVVPHESWPLVFGLVLGFVGWMTYAAMTWREGPRPGLSLFASLGGGAMCGVALCVARLLLLWLIPRASLAPLDGIGRPLFFTIGVPLVLLSFGVGACFCVGLASRLRTATDEEREWWARVGAWLLLACVVWTGGSALVLLFPALLLDWVALLYGSLSLGTISGGIAVILGRSAWSQAGGARGERGGFLGTVLAAGPRIAAPICLAIMVALFSVVASWILAYCIPKVEWSWQSGAAHLHVVNAGTILLLAAWTVGLCLTGIAASYFINANKFSMHAMYRDRLVRAYLGASNPSRHPDPFTGLEPADNIALYNLRPATVHPLDWRVLSDCDVFLARLQSVLEAPTSNFEGYLRDALRLIPGFKGQFAHVKTRPFPEWLRDLALHAVNDIIIHDDLLTMASPGAKIAASGFTERALRNRVVLEFEFPGLIPAVLGTPPPIPPIPGPIAEGGAQATAEAAVGPVVLTPARQAPLHVLNMTLNLVQTRNTAWQQRKAMSFSASPHYCGAGRRYRSSNRYAGGTGSVPRGISLGAVMAISGAAASPNMGYHSSPSVTFLMTLFNVRLGAWLGNPDIAGNNTYTDPAPKLGLIPTVQEALGLTNEFREYVYLSDGGHFENLAIYEMLRRRCKTIVVVDGGCDPTCSLSDLGNAVEKARDLGVSIRFNGRLPMRAREAELKRGGTHVAVGTIVYPRPGQVALEGQIVYLKAGFYGGEPTNVFSYAMANRDFPHETTADQFFTEAQFEAYRALGEHAVEEIMRVPATEQENALSDFIDRAKRIPVRHGEPNCVPRPRCGCPYGGSDRR